MYVVVKKFKKLSLSLFLFLFIASFMTVPAWASAPPVLEGQEIPLNGADSGYKLIVPGYVETKKVTVTYGDETKTLDVIVRERPEPDPNKRYFIFQIVTTDNSASEIWSQGRAVNYPASAGMVHTRFDDGRATYMFLVNDMDLSEMPENVVYDFSFQVSDTYWKTIFDVQDLYFMFVEPGTPPTGDQVEEAPDAPAAPEAPSAPLPTTEPVTAAKTAKPTSSTVVVNGKVVAFEAYNIEGSNYFKLRDLAMAVNGTEKQFQVGWNGAENAIQLTTKEAYTPDGSELAVSGNPQEKTATATNSKIFIDGRQVELTAYNISGYNYFKLRDVAKALDFNVTWDAKNNSIGIDTKNSYIEP